MRRHGVEKQGPSSSFSNAFVNRRQRRLSITMPGSLFPRSESLEPEETPAAVPNTSRHVTFAATPLEISRRYQTLHDLGEAGSSQLPIPFTPSHLEVEGAPAEQDSPLDRRGVKSVKAALGRFHVDENDADPSIMLPKSTVSPSKAPSEPSPSRSPSRDKGKGRAVDPSPERALSPSRVDKGKGKAVNDPFLDMDSNVSGVIRYRGKQKELDDAREEFRRNELRWEQAGQGDEDESRKQDKLRIRMLEDEIEKLKAEVRPFYQVK
jgi:hypothetical protein